MSYEFNRVLVRPNDATAEWVLTNTDGDLKSIYIRDAIKRGVGQLLYRHLAAGGTVVVVDGQDKILLEVVVKPPQT